ncbi:glycosyltransferase family 2 protein [Corynebacterium sp. TAE3-ERU30]|uniref:glycosyltransferase family 2 protein n=1 Tax=Corynebacterium sp. TAE3-ERU30 TaxID=2849496 RepID=UPI001C46B646|nr:glycosyltransferase family 2 protein [Corynebacterium sp. TAE3-ERU30]
MIVDTNALAIITVTYSPGRHLREFLDSLPAATSRPVRVVMADNGSRDGAPEAAERDYDCAEFLPTGGNVGYGHAINIAAQHLHAARAAGEVDPRYLLVVNPDVVFGPGSIDTLLNTADTWQGSVGSVGPYIKEPDGSAYPSARAVPTLGLGIGHALLGGVWKNNPWSRRYRNDADMSTAHTAGWLSGSCLLLNWEAFDAIGGFDERYFMYMEDVDLGDRLGRAGYENVFAPAAVITHAKGHVADRDPGRLLPAHHESAYRFQADRYPKAYHLPLRVALKVGLKLREILAVARARRSAD